MWGRGFASGRKIYILWDVQDVPQGPMGHRKAAKAMEDVRREAVINSTPLTGFR